MAEGWIKLHRSLLDWEWWDDFNTTRVWLYILLKANHEDKIWKGKSIKSGSFVTSFSSLSAGCGLTVNEVRTAIKHLEASKNVTRKSTGNAQVITVANWALYQFGNKELTSKSTDESHSVNRRFTTNKKERMKEGKKKDIDMFIAYARENIALQKALTAFEEMRKTMKQPMTDHAKKLLCDKLDKLAKAGEDIIACLEAATFNNWKSVYPISREKAKKTVEKGSSYDYDLIAKQATQKMMERLKDGHIGK